MRLVHLAASLAGLALAATPAAVDAQRIYAYPSHGQSKAKQHADYKACHKWAVSKSGFDPGYAPPPVRAGGALRGAAGGAAGGALIGAIGGNAGRGAAIGAATGGVIGAIRQNRAARQQQARLDSYNHALAACFKGRGYTVS